MELAAKRKLKLAIGLFILLIIISTILGLFSPVKSNTLGSIGDFISGITGPILNAVGLYFIIVTFEEQRKVTKIQEEIQTDEKKVHDYKVLHGLLKSLIDEYKSIEEDFDKLIDFVNRKNVNRIERINAIRRNSRCVNFILHYGNLGIDIANANISSVDNKHLIIEYRNFGEYNITRFFKSTRALSIQPNELTIDVVILSNSWALMMDKLSSKLGELLEKTFEVDSDYLLKNNKEIVESYYNARSANSDNRINLLNLI